MREVLEMEEALCFLLPFDEDYWLQNYPGVPLIIRIGRGHLVRPSLSGLVHTQVS